MFVIMLPALALSPLRAEGCARDAIADDAVDDPDAADGPDDADNAAGGRLRFGVEHFDQHVFGGEGPAAAAAKRARLKELYLAGTEVSDAGAAELNRALRRVRIYK